MIAKLQINHQIKQKSCKSFCMLGVFDYLRLKSTSLFIIIPNCLS